MKKLVFLLLVIIILLFISCEKNKITNRDNNDLQGDVFLNEERWVSGEDGLRLREKPGTSSPTILTIPRGERVMLLEETGEELTIKGHTGKWSRIEWEGCSGWVFGGYLCKDEIFLLSEPIFTSQELTYEKIQEDEIFKIKFEKEMKTAIIVSDSARLYKDLESFEVKETLSPGDEIRIKNTIDEYYTSEAGYSIFFEVFPENGETYYLDSRDCVFDVFFTDRYFFGTQLILQTEEEEDLFIVFEKPVLLIKQNGLDVHTFDLGHAFVNRWNDFSIVEAKSIIVTDKNNDGIDEIIIAGDIRGGLYATGLGYYGTVEIWCNISDTCRRIFSYNQCINAGDEIFRTKTWELYDMEDRDNDGFLETLMLTINMEKGEYNEMEDGEYIYSIKEYNTTIITYTWNGEKYFETERETKPSNGDFSREY